MTGSGLLGITFAVFLALPILSFMFDACTGSLDEAQGEE